MSKGSKQRPESKPGAYADGWDAIFNKPDVIDLEGEDFDVDLDQVDEDSNRE